MGAQSFHEAVVLPHCLRTWSRSCPPDKVDHSMPVAPGAILCADDEVWTMRGLMPVDEKEASRAGSCAKNK